MSEPCLNDSPSSSNGNGHWPEGTRETLELINNVIASRADYMARILDPRRDINDECGYPTGYIDVATYQELYNRDPVAVRIVQVLPKECWRVQPLVYEDDNSTVNTAFEKAWQELPTNLGTEPSYYTDEEENLIWEYVRRADELSGIGRYGILLLGIDDKMPLSEPANMEARGGRKLLYLRAFPESLVNIGEVDNKIGSPRFGQPETYTINLDTDCGVYLPDGATVHWTRVIHVIDNADSSETKGTPRLQPVLNRVLDLRKLYGGSAEMYWRGAFPGLSLETHPQLNPSDARLDETKLRDMMENYANGLQRYLALLGFTAKSLAPQVVDPTNQIRVQIEAICIRLGVPKRIFMGSERGELASAQDDKTWNDRLKERQRNYLTPRLIVPLVNRLINLGVLPKPKRFKVRWPDLAFQTEQDIARVAIIKTEALMRYVQSLPNAIIAPMDFLTEILGMSDQKAATILTNVEEKGWSTVYPLLIKMLGGSATAAQVTATADSANNTFLKKSSGDVVSDTNGGLRTPGGGTRTAPPSVL